MTDEELAEETGLPWNTANAVRYTLWQQGLISLTDVKRRTKNGATAAVYAYDPRGPELHVEAVTLTLDDKVRARAALYSMVMRDLDLGLDVPPEVIQLGRWLDAKVMLGEKRELERQRSRGDRGG